MLFGKVSNSRFTIIVRLGKAPCCMITAVYMVYKEPTNMDITWQSLGHAMSVSPSHNNTQYLKANGNGRPYRTFPYYRVIHYGWHVLTV